MKKRIVGKKSRFVKISLDMKPDIDMFLDIMGVFNQWDNYTNIYFV